MLLFWTVYLGKDLITISKILAHIRMISEGSCDTEDWSNGYWIFSFAIRGINYIFKYNKSEKLLILVVSDWLN